jgi:hypothetical protein
MRSRRQFAAVLIEVLGLADNLVRYPGSDTPKEVRPSNRDISVDRL